MVPHYNARVRVHSSAPTRIDLAGGTLDIWPLYLFHDDAQTLNAAIDIRAECHLSKSADGRLRLFAEDTGATADVAHWSELDDAVGLRLVTGIVRFFRSEGLTVTTRSGAPVGAGLAGSSALNIALCGALSAWHGREFDPESLIELALNLEAQAIAVPTGAQDYRPAMYGGLAALEMGPRGVTRVPLAVDVDELAARMVLVYTGQSRDSGINNWEVTKRHIDRNPEIVSLFGEIRDVAVGMRRALEAGAWTDVARHVRLEWDLRKRLAPGVTTARLDDFIRRGRDAGADAAKVCGAGGGGCLIFLADPDAVPALGDALASAGAQLLDYRVDQDGIARDDRLMPMDNRSIARIFEQIADLLEIKGANPFKIRAYRNAADIVATTAERIADLTDGELRAIPGIGKDLAAKLRELADRGTLAYYDELLQEFPPTILDLLKLQGLGPKTVALLYERLGIASIDQLEAAAKDGQLRRLRGHGPKKEALVLRAIAERRRRTGRHLLADVHRVATALVDHLRAHAPAATLVPVGSLRRGCDTCGDVDILAISADTSLMQAFVEFEAVDRILGHGETKSSVRLRDGIQADLRIVPPESAGAALQYFSGSKAHNIALRDRALQRGLKLNEYGLFRSDDGARVAGDTEMGIYEALGLRFIAPELRENRGELAAAETDALPELVERRHLRGDLHSHTTATDGQASIEAMALAALAAGLEYLAITDHSQALAMANGLDEQRALAHADAIRAVDARVDGITLLAGIECDIRSDGSLDLSEDCLAQLDLVIASVHSGFGQDETEMTERVLRAMESPVVDIVGHPTGRQLLRREPSQLNVERLVGAAARLGVALEINSQARRLDLSDVHARLARDHQVPLVISSDAHDVDSFRLLEWGTLVARRAWLEPAHLLNTLPLDQLRTRLRRHRRNLQTS